MRGYTSLNFPAFFDAEEDLVARGYRVLNPARMDSELGLSPIRDISECELYEIVRRDIDAVLKCDMVCLLPGWENSYGARAEKAVAEWLGKRVYEMDDLVKLDDSARKVEREVRIA